MTLSKTTIDTAVERYLTECIGTPNDAQIDLAARHAEASNINRHADVDSFYPHLPTTYPGVTFEQSNAALRVINGEVWASDNPELILALSQFIGEAIEA